VITREKWEADVFYEVWRLVMINLDDNRRTGRTSRMLAEAERLVREEGKPVLIVAANYAQSEALLKQIPKDISGSIEVLTLREAATRIDFGEGDWPRMWGFCVCLADHYATELFLEECAGWLIDQRNQWEAGGE